MKKTASLNSTPVLENIRLHFKNLHPAEQKLGAFIMDNPELTLDMNVAELADASSISTATVIRFCQKLQYSGFFQMKLQLSHDIAQSQLLNQRHSGIRNTTSNEKLVVIANNVTSMNQHTSDVTFTACASAIMKSQTIYVIGNGYCKILGANIIYRLTRMGYRCAGGGYSETDFEILHMGQPGDVGIFISRSGEDKKTIEELSAAKANGILTIALTDALHNPLSMEADHSLSTGVKLSDRIIEEYTSSDIYMHILIDLLLQYLTPRTDNFEYLNDVVSAERL